MLRLLTPCARDLSDDRQGCASTVIGALLEVTLDTTHLVGDVSKAEGRLLTRRGECVKRSRLHLDRKDTRFTY